jgi:hypothetical protein
MSVAMTTNSPYVPTPGAQPDDVQPRWVDPYEATTTGEHFDSLAAEAEASTLRFDRGFKTKLYVLESGGWMSITSLDDDFHSMRIALRIAADGQITEAAGRMLRRPYDTCPRAVESLEAIVGATVARPGAHRQIGERIPRTEGCLHLYDMLVVAFRAFRISKGHDIDPHYHGEHTRKMMLQMLPNMRDTCVSFAIDHAEDQ